jgi:hypothetical protein
LLHRRICELSVPRRRRLAQPRRLCPILVDLSLRYRHDDQSAHKSSPNCQPRLGTGPVKRAVSTVEDTGSPAFTAILDVRGIDGGLYLVAADRERESAVYSGLQRNAVCPLGYTTALRDDCSERPRWWKADLAWPCPANAPAP